MIHQIVIDIPQVPNFLRSKPTGRRSPETFDVALFKDEELQQVGAEWTRALVDNARKRRGAPPR